MRTPAREKGIKVIETETVSGTVFVAAVTGHDDMVECTRKFQAGLTGPDAKRQRLITTSQYSCLTPPLHQNEDNGMEFVIFILAGLVIFALGMLIYVKYDEKH